MKSEIKKEILTKEKCRLDLMVQPEDKFPMILLSAFGLVMLVIIVLIGILGSGWMRFVVMAPFALIFLAIVGFFSVDALVRRRRNRRVLSREFHIVRDVLVRATMDACYKLPRRYDNGLRDHLEFSKHSFFLQPNRYYRWSGHPMSARGVYNTALPGDTFYLLVYDDDPDRKPIMVYNAKFFDYDDAVFLSNA